MELHGTTGAHTPPKQASNFWETVRFVAISIIIVFAFRTFVAQPFIVSGESMVPTFLDGEYLIVDEVSYRFKEPKRDDVIIMRYPLDTKTFFIKRIIGLPGETLEFNGSAITITPQNGDNPINLAEPYVVHAGNDFFSVTLGSDEYFVLGDNRSASSDSRRWGALPAKNIVGRPFVRLFPFSTFSWFPGTAIAH
ncbi:MAG: signal peptidase I [Candidatus Taylorbacteria bacterium RIFCSPHIGHO2_01_FULL_46_22b]|uniref:Signal peptidase I n=1 Tax=Candidatus Taylorbacteria bacterium RIFCSPHIGHO2_01_FULL_46_22b TaxID=1802301 RepID=A0A1G2M3V9_9BACT|nr:MAG: signal peptidase I [Candidatus Taylorbacteria bacterium RIFCSPHIGHO2_01_FULL_46_22b]